MRGSLGGASGGRRGSIRAAGILAFATCLVACGGGDGVVSDPGSDGAPTTAAPDDDPSPTPPEATDDETATPDAPETPADSEPAFSTVPVCDFVPVEEIAAVTGRAVDAAEDASIGFRGECAYTGGGEILVAVAAQFYGSNIDFGFSDYAEAATATELDGVGDRAAVLDAEAEFELVMQSGDYIVLVGVRGERRDQPDADGYREIGGRVLELLAPALT